MADTQLSDVVGVPEPMFVSRSANPSLVLSSGLSGTLVTLTPPSGQRVRLNGLGVNEAIDTNVEADITVTVGSVDVISALTLSNTSADAAGEFCILNGIGNATGNFREMTGRIPPIIGRIDETIVISKAGTTTYAIGYNYEYGL